LRNPIFASSYQLADELRDAGVPFDYRDALSRHSFRVELPRYFPSWVYELGPMDTGWVILVRLCTDSPLGTTIRDWSFEPPWEDHDIIWGCELADFLSKKDQELYKHFFKSRLWGVLNEGHLIRRGHPVEGILCGRSVQPIGKFSHGFVSAKLSFTDDQGNTVQIPIELNVNQLRYPTAGRLPGGKARPRRFIDLADSSAIPAGPDSESGSRA
jgi:hypothetical protein